MATKKHSKGNKAKSPQHPVTAPNEGGPTVEQLAELGRRMLEPLAESDQREAARIIAEQQGRQRESITLTGDRLEQARKALSDINLGAVACYHLSRDAIDCPEATEWLLIGIQNIAKVSARKCDVIDALLGERYGFGNFLDELTPIPEVTA